MAKPAAQIAARREGDASDPTGKVEQGELLNRREFHACPIAG
ncbi:MAG: hypothetical protein WBO92_00265 [Candidatus Moraniibacteriota bacterium]